MEIKEIVKKVVSGYVPETPDELDTAVAHIIIDYTEDCDIIISYETRRYEEGYCIRLLTLFLQGEADYKISEQDYLDAEEALIEWLDDCVKSNIVL